MLDSGTLKEYWENPGEVDNDLNGIASTCELLWESSVISETQSKSLKGEIEKLKTESMILRKKDIEKPPSPVNVKAAKEPEIVERDGNIDEYSVEEG